MDPIMNSLSIQLKSLNCLPISISHCIQLWTVCWFKLCSQIWFLNYFVCQSQLMSLSVNCQPCPVSVNEPDLNFLPVQFQSVSVFRNCLPVQFHCLPVQLSPGKLLMNFLCSLHRSLDRICSVCLLCLSFPLVPVSNMGLYPSAPPRWSSAPAWWSFALSTPPWWSSVLLWWPSALPWWSFLSCSGGLLLCLFRMGIFRPRLLCCGGRLVLV